jgi:hypothetical protein
MTPEGLFVFIAVVIVTTAGMAAVAWITMRRWHA